MRGAVAAAITCLALGLCGCFGGGDDDADGDGSQGEEYALSVEGITDDAYEDAQTALVTLNRLADRALSPTRAAAALSERARRVGTAQAELEALDAPSAAQTSAGDLESSLGDLELALRLAATDAGADRSPAELSAIARDDARVVLAEQSGMSALGRAVGRLAIESTD
jgi:hypothetical protein